MQEQSNNNKKAQTEKGVTSLFYPKADKISNIGVTCFAPVGERREKKKKRREKKRRVGGKGSIMYLLRPWGEKMVKYLP